MAILFSMYNFYQLSVSYASSTPSLKSLWKVMWEVGAMTLLMEVSWLLKAALLWECCVQFDI